MKSADKVGHDSEVVILMRTPDWLSTNPNDWRFYGSGKGAATKQQGVSTSAGPIATRSSIRQQLSSGSTSASATSAGRRKKGEDDNESSKSSPSSFFQSLL